MVKRTGQMQKSKLSQTESGLSWNWFDLPRSKANKRCKCRNVFKTLELMYLSSQLIDNY